MFLPEIRQCKGNNTGIDTLINHSIHKYLTNKSAIFPPCHPDLENRDNYYLSCADPGIFVRGGGGVQVSPTKKALTTYLFLFFLVLSLFYRSQMVNFKEFYHFSRFQWGSNIFQGGGGGGGVQLFPGGSNCLFPIETHITCDFPGGSGPPVPPSGSALDYTIDRPPVRGDNPRAFASGLSYVQVDKHVITIVYHQHHCRPCTSRDISC